MKKTKIAAILLSAVLTVSAFSVPAYAAETTTAVSESATKTWNGKTTLKAGTTYTVEKNLVISKKITIPSKAKVIIKKGTVTLKSTGSLNIRGTLQIEDSAKLKVSGKLYLYSGKVLKNYGKLTFGSNAKVTLNGKFTNYTTGVISGTPNTLSVSKKAKITNKGTIETDGIVKKTVALPTSEEISALIDTAVASFIIDGDYSQILKLAIPEEYLAKLVEEMAMAGISLDDYIALLTSQNVMTTLKVFDENGKEVEVSIIDVVGMSSKAENIKAATAEELATYQATLDETNNKYGLSLKAESGFIADVTLIVKTIDGATYSSKTESLSFVTVNGKLYVASFSMAI